MHDQCSTKRQKLAQVAASEAALQVQGNDQKGGPGIEKYLVLVRDALRQRPATRHLAELGVGFDWCGAFVYYCCRAAGFTFSPRPSMQLPGTFAAVFIWREWALLPKNQFFLPATATPQPGDLVIFDHLLEKVVCDHIGVVTAVDDHWLTTAEGNVANRSGLFQRSLDQQINGYIRILRDDAAADLQN
jgi:hypothetical protein